MIQSLALHFARPLAIQQSLRAMSRLTAHVLVIAPSTRTTLEFAQALCRTRQCLVTRGPVTAGFTWPTEETLRTPSEIAYAFAGQPTLTRTILSFPDQLPCASSNCVLLPMLSQPHAFSTLDALIVMRHRPRAFALSASSRRWGMRLVELHYSDAFDTEGRLISLHGLMSNLLRVMALDLVTPPADWLARTYLAQRSEKLLFVQEREDLKDIECLLRMQMQSRFCDKEMTREALNAVIMRQRFLHGTALP